MSEADYSPEYVTAASAEALTPNFYIEIDGITERFSKLPVVGLANNVPHLLVNPTFSGAKIEVDSPKTPLRSITFTLIDLNSQVTNIFSGKDIHEKTVKFFVSPDASLDFSKYGLKAQYRLKELSSPDGTKYIVKCVETGELLLNRLVIGSTILTADIDDTQTTGIIVENSDEFTGSSPFKAYLGEERLSFTSVNPNGELQGVTRGIDSTTADSHIAGDEFDIYREILAENFVDLILQLIISPGGGGPFDVLDFGMGIDQDLVDVPTFENIRDTTSYLTTTSTDVLFRGDEDKFLDFIEKNFLDTSGIRIWYRDNGKISALIIAEPAPVDPPDIVKNDMVGGKMPLWQANSRRIINRILVKVNWNPSTDKFERELEFKDLVSIATFGLKKTRKINSKALQTGNGALTFLTSFANKYFSFYSTPAPTLKSTKLMPPKQFLDPGDIVEISHPDLPDLEDGVRGVFGDEIQILGKKFDFRDFTTTYDIFYSLLLNLRNGFIGPRGFVAAGSFSTTVFDLKAGDEEKFGAGDVVILWDEDFNTPPATHGESTIVSVVGQTVTVSPAFSTTPTENYRLRYAGYDSVQETQKEFMFVGDPAAADFPDGTGPYTIGA